MRLFFPIVLTVIFLFYILYLAFVKKNLKDNTTKILYPGLFFILVWGIIYFELLK